jgi:outer membrane protein TolC
MYRPAFALALGLLGCTRYVPRPLQPENRAEVFRARRLDDSALVAWVSRFAGSPSAQAWSDRQLAVAGLRLRSELARARADWVTAQAGERAAGARPQPGLQGDVERAVSGSEGASPWVVSLAAMHTVELGGKRGARLLQARARTTVAESDLRLAAWRIAQQVRAAAASAAAAQAEADELGGEVEVLQQVREVERARFAEAVLSGSELARTDAELQQLQADRSVARGAARVARADLAAAVGLPAQALDGMAIVLPGDSSCARENDQPIDSLESRALRRRAEVGRALGEYAVAEAELRGQVARQYPDLELGPGFIWDQGVHRWILAVALPALLGFRNRGAIHQAEASREAAAARVTEAQDSVLAQVEAAVQGCLGATEQIGTADSVVVATTRGLELARAAYQRGETSRLEPAQAELALARARRLARQASRRGFAAALALQAATGEWWGVADESWPDPRMDQTTTGDGH